jgi:hypothetical protein
MINNIHWSTASPPQTLLPTEVLSLLLSVEAPRLGLNGTVSMGSLAGLTMIVIADNSTINSQTCIRSPGVCKYLIVDQTQNCLDTILASGGPKVLNILRQL